jgi:hypothetical protein
MKQRCTLHSKMWSVCSVQLSTLWSACWLDDVKDSSCAQQALHLPHVAIAAFVLYYTYQLLLLNACMVLVHAPGQQPTPGYKQASMQAGDMHCLLWKHLRHT